MIRRADPGDLGAVAELERLCLGDDAWSDGLLREGLSGDLPTVTYLVAERDGEVVGHAVVSDVGDVVELQRIAVHPGERRSGVARALLAEVLASTTPEQRVLLEVREDNEVARALYAGAGFAELARRERYYRDGAAAVVMELSSRSLPTASDA